MNKKPKNYEAHWPYEIFELTRDLFAAIGVVTALFGAVGYMWGYFA